MFSVRKDSLLMQLSMMGDHLLKSAQQFVDFRVWNECDLFEMGQAIRAAEREGERYTLALIQELSNTFITPIEREDIMTLGLQIDDVMKRIEKVASRYEMYQITTLDDRMVKFFQLIHKSCKEIQAATALIANQQLLELRPHAIAIKEYETKCDEVLRISIKHLFVIEKDPILLIQIKDLYELLEAVTDGCQGVANTLEAIVMRNM